MKIINLDQYIETKINQMNELLIQYSDKLNIENAKEVEKQNQELLLVIQGKLQAYYTVIKSLRADQRYLELMHNENSEGENPPNSSSNIIT